VTLDRLLKQLRATNAELLMVIDRPRTPLHTNASERDIRCHVTRRKVNARKQNDVGRDCRDAFLGLAKTCGKLGIEIWDYGAAGSRSPEARSSSYSTSTSGAHGSAPLTLLPSPDCAAV